MKKVFAAVSGAVLLALSVPVFALTADQAKAKAEKYVPSGSIHAITEIDDGNYEVKFDRKDAGERFEIKISQATEEVVSIESKKYDHKGASNVKLSAEAVKKIVMGEQKDAEIPYVILETDDGFNKYQVSFRTQACYGEYEIHPVTGAILERDIHMGAIPTADSLTNQQPPNGDIGLEKAKTIVLEKAPGAQVKELKLDRDDGRAVYEGELRNGNWEYEFKLDAATGSVLEWEQEYDD